ncbi:centromere protein B dimerization [Ophiocordyceps camponoti-floridani]|uniref:Centromere protein B dimerization n=1 Tax=Ophiocordyceps camponoti-floridani TaxID=2030778 RepID=A0A8H4VB50_9HYPO|nr:centromere protein B dimerization [Ophiocordyceps camponoti-floridani]
MRDRQARGKDPYNDEDEDMEDEEDYRLGGGCGGGGCGHHGGGGGGGDDEGQHDGDDEGSDFGLNYSYGVGVDRTADFEERERKAFALSILTNPDKLSMFAQSNNDSIPSQRLRFTAVLAGFESIPISEVGRRKDEGYYHHDNYDPDFDGHGRPHCGGASSPSSSPGPASPSSRRDKGKARRELDFELLEVWEPLQ